MNCSCVFPVVVVRDPFRQFQGMRRGVVGGLAPVELLSSVTRKGETDVSNVYTSPLAAGGEKQPVAKTASVVDGCNVAPAT
ncbi:hypothetical protein L2E82_23143 [Cichorium intybus]|uniref:Uncharacterized protein n=1 Tax=Cichorium intybus TaxID=13427 RepID=A0ACB9DZC2_CICIN|nr:hypothetical protein L2E82_23143 [Cichorium intybus]